MLAIALGFILALMLIHPDIVLLSAAGGLSIFAQSVLPTLFPYMVFCQLLSSELSHLGQRASLLVAALLGWAGGSPTGARLSVQLYDSGRINHRQLRMLCVLCGTVSPMFILGTIGNLMHSSAFGICVLVSHYIGAICVCILTAFIPFTPSHNAPTSQNQAAKSTLNDAVNQSCKAMLNIGAYITLFSVLTALLGVLLSRFSPRLQVLLHAILEMAGGSHAIASMHLPHHTACMLITACVSFNGLSILMQNTAFTRPANIGGTLLIPMRIIHAILSGGLAFMLYPSFMRFVPASTSSDVLLPSQSISYAPTLFILLIVLLCYILKPDTKKEARGQ